MRFVRLPSINRERDVFWLCFGLCLVVCLLIIFLGPPLFGVSQYFGKANDGYIELARSLVRGDGYVFEQGGPAVFHRPPLYPVMLVPIAFLPDFLQRPALILVQSALVGFIGVLIFKIAKYLFNVSVARISVGLFLLNPWVYWNAKNPMTPIVQAMLYTLFAAFVGSELLVVFGRGTPPGRIRVWFKRLAIGALAAALALTHSAMLAVDIALLLVLLVAGIARRNRQALKTSIIAAVTMSVLIAPWTYRNWAVFHRFIPIAGGGGLAYFNGNVHWAGIVPEPQRKGESCTDAGLRDAGIKGKEAAHTHWKGLKDVELEDKVNKKMVEHIRAHPGAFMKKILLNAVEYYFPMLTYPYLAVKVFSIESFVITIFHLVLWALVLFGIWRDRKEQTHSLLTVLMLGGIGLYAVWFLPFATFIGHSLYTFGTMPFLSILAARGLVTRQTGVFYSS